MISINILIMTDAEGLCGIYQNEQVKATHPLYGECRRYMTRQINELAAGFKGAGVERVYVRDCHGGACSAIWEDISADVDRIIQGDTGTNRMPYIESVDAVALLGYHAMAGTPTAVLEHTMMSTLWQKFYDPRYRSRRNSAGRQHRRGLRKAGDPCGRGRLCLRRG
ncbi:MAG: M55 family metallopeptidase [Clostridia bacterium]